MKINALFIENEANLGKPQFAGYVETFDDIPEICSYALPNFFADKPACKAFAIKLRECFDAKGDPENFFDSIIQTNLYGWANTWKIAKNEMIIYIMKNLVSLDALKPNSGLNESLNKLEVQDIKDKVQDWVYAHYDDYDSQDREDLLDDINNNAEMYVDMLEDTGLGKSGRETQDEAYNILKEIIEKRISPGPKPEEWREDDFLEPGETKEDWMKRNGVTPANEAAKIQSKQRRSCLNI